MTHPRKWEYDVDDGLSAAASPEEVVEHLDAMGAEGWELVAMRDNGSFYRCVYKRPIRGEDEADEYEEDEYEEDEDYDEEDYDEDGSIRVNPPPPEQPKGFWGRR